MFITFQDEMQYIFLEKNFIFMDFLAVKDAATDVIQGDANEFRLFQATKMT